MITLTANAAEVVRGDINKEKLPAGTALRLGVVNDGCKDSNTQYRYVLELDSEAVRPGDHLFESEGITILVDQQSLAPSRRGSAGSQARPPRKRIHVSKSSRGT
jgi:Fe-S cluster assembly iron-binding protein IscA